MERPPGRRTCLYDAEQLDAVVERMALQAAALLRGCERIAVIGLLRRGAPLADRGVLRLPLRADVVGLRLDVAPTDVIECNVPPYEPSWRIELLQPERGAGNED